VEYYKGILMAIRFVLLSAFTCLSIVFAVPARGDFLGSIPRDIKRRQCWPKPFVCADRQTVGAPFAVMITNGWQRQNTLGDSYFEEATGQLTEAGQLKVRWIVTEAPAQHRAIYVHRTMTAQETAARVSAVQQFAAGVLRQGEAVPILETDIDPQGWPADQVDAIGRKFQSTTPAPRLPSANPGSSSGAEAK
jgi:hypothetical protein